MYKCFNHPHICSLDNFLECKKNDQNISVAVRKGIRQGCHKCLIKIENNYKSPKKNTTLWVIATIIRWFPSMCNKYIRYIKINYNLNYIWCLTNIQATKVHLNIAKKIYIMDPKLEDYIYNNNSVAFAISE